MERRSTVLSFSMFKNRAIRNRYSIQRFAISSYNKNLDETSISIMSMQYPDSELEMNIKHFKENGLGTYLFFFDLA